MSQGWAFCEAAERSQRRRLLDQFVAIRTGTNGDRAAVQKFVKSLS